MPGEPGPPGHPSHPSQPGVSYSSTCWTHTHTCTPECVLNTRPTDSIFLMICLHPQGLGSQMATGFDGKTGPQAMLSGSRVRRYPSYNEVVTKMTKICCDLFQSSNLQIQNIFFRLTLYRDVSYNAARCIWKSSWIAYIDIFEVRFSLVQMSAFSLLAFGRKKSADSWIQFF